MYSILDHSIKASDILNVLGVALMESIIGHINLGTACCHHSIVLLRGLTNDLKGSELSVANNSLGAGTRLTITSIRTFLRASLNRARHITKGRPQVSTLNGLLLRLNRLLQFSNSDLQSPIRRLLGLSKSIAKRSNGLTLSRSLRCRVSAFGTLQTLPEGLVLITKVLNSCGSLVNGGSNTLCHLLILFVCGNLLLKVGNLTVLLLGSGLKVGNLVVLLLRSSLKVGNLVVLLLRSSLKVGNLVVLLLNCAIGLSVLVITLSNLLTALANLLGVNIVNLLEKINHVLTVNTPKAAFLKDARLFSLLSKRICHR